MTTQSNSSRFTALKRKVRQSDRIITDLRELTEPGPAGFDLQKIKDLCMKLSDIRASLQS